MRFDDTVPGRTRVPADGWTNAASVNRLAVELPDGQSRGPSGIGGYAITRDGTVPGTTVTHAGERVVLDLGALAEGVTPVRARAISGAGVPSGDVTDAFVRVDRTAPEVTLTAEGSRGGDQGTWLRRNVVLRATGRDQPGLSGMDGAGPDLPVTRGGHIEYQVDGGPVQRERGAAAQIDLAEDGVHVVSARAIDVAGNASAPERATFRVDRHVPAGVIETPPNILSPRRLRARVPGEECLASATLELRPAGEHDWMQIDASTEHHAVTADVPDDKLPAGTYDVRFRVTDCAGNSATIDRFENGSSRVRLPLRDALDLSAGIAAAGHSGLARATVRMGTPVLVRGRLLTIDGRSVAGRRVEVQERVGPGDWRVRLVRVTDDLGRVAARLRPGPSRRLRLVVAPNDADGRRRQPHAARLGARAGDDPREPHEPAQRAGAALLRPRPRRAPAARRARARASGVQPAQGPLAAGADRGPAQRRPRALARFLPLHRDRRNDGDLPVPSARPATSGPPVRGGTQPVGGGDGAGLERERPRQCRGRSGTREERLSWVTRENLSRVRFAHPSQENRSRVRFAHPSQENRSRVRFAHPSQENRSRVRFAHPSPFEGDVC